jgi:membrane protease YdiL (CAAX protease family)
MLEALFALVVLIALPVRAWRRYRRGSSPSPRAAYLGETALLTAALAALLWRRGVPLTAIGVQPPFVGARFAADVFLCVTAVIGLDGVSLLLATRRARPVAVRPALPRAGVFADALEAQRAGGWFVAVAIAGAVWEELCFRATLFSFVPQNPWELALGVACGSLVFGAQHLRNGTPGLTYAAFFGVLFSCLYLITRDLPAVVIAHVAGNLFAGLYAAPRIARAQRTAVFWA